MASKFIRRANYFFSGEHELWLNKSRLTQALLEAVLEIPVRSLFAGQPSEIFGAPVGGGVITGEVNLDPDSSACLFPELRVS